MRILTIGVTFLLLQAAWPTWANDALVPKYKPSSRSPEAIDVLSNAYGASRDAPNAIQIGEQVADFELPRAGGGTVSLAAKRGEGPVAVIFYRGHW